MKPLALTPRLNGGPALQPTRRSALTSNTVKPRTKLLRLDGGRVLEVPVVTRPEAVSQVDWETLCRVNDAIVKRVRYDHQRALTGNSSGPQSPHETLTRGLGVCMDYAALFEASARRVGLAAKSVISTSMNHAWNLVYLGGAWWNVDVTWNAGGSLERGTPVPERIRNDTDFRRRYLLTTLRSESALLRYGVIRQTHTVDDARGVDFTRTLQAMALVTRIEALLGGQTPMRTNLPEDAHNRGVKTVVKLPSGEARQQIVRLYREYLRIEASHPLAVSFRLGI